MSHETAACNVRELRATHERRPKITWLLFFCGLAAGAGSAGAAAEAAADAVPHRVVRYQADSLATEQGAKILYRRIAKAAEEVCPVTPGSRLASAVVMRCRKESITRAVHQIDSPSLAAVYANRLKSG